MKIIVLDRDGVINQDSSQYIKSAKEWLPEPGSIEAIVKLKKAGWTVAIATNQSGIGRGYYSQKTLSTIHLKMQKMLAEQGAKVDWISYSPYVPANNSVCRKPLTGMLRAIENRYNMSLKGVIMIGDSLADIQVALANNMQPILVKTGKGNKTLASQESCLQGIPVFNNLLAAVEGLL